MKGGRYCLVFVVLGILLLLAAVLNVCVGSVSIPLPHILRILCGQGGSQQELNIIFKIRLPRVIMAAVLGGALSLSGFLLQTYFQNPIAGPFVLGISSGAKMMVAVAMILLFKNGIRPSSWLLVLAAFVGALIATSFILLTSRYVSHIASLLVAGIMIGYITSAITECIVSFADESDIANLHGWSQGSFSGMSMDSCAVAAVVVGTAVFCVFLLAKPIAAYRLGEDYARSMGVDVALFRPLLILLSSVLSACVTAFAGPVSFVGIAVPFLVKQLLGTAHPLLAIPGCFLGGAVFCLYSDFAARMVLAPAELNISVVTSLFGAPVVIVMLLVRHGGRER